MARMKDFAELKGLRDQLKENERVRAIEQAEREQRERDQRADDLVGDRAGVGQQLVLPEALHHLGWRPGKAASGNVVGTI